MGGHIYLIGAWVLFGLSFLGIMASVGYWVYRDAQIRSDKPGMWALIAIVTPYLFGLMVYLLVGRTKQGKGKKRHILPIIVSVVFLFASVVLIFSNPNRVPLSYGTQTGLVETRRSENWQISFISANQTSYSRTIQLGEHQLQAFHITAESAGGTITLTISQQDTAEAYDISNYSGFIDLSGVFLPDIPIHMTITCEQARDGRIMVEWSEQSQ